MATEQVLNDTHYFLCEDYIIKIGDINGRKNTQDNKKTGHYAMALWHF